MSYYFGDPAATSARIDAASALWREAKVQLAEAQAAQAAELALHDQAWLRAAYPPTAAARRRHVAVLEAQQRVAALEAEMQLVLEMEEVRERAWRSAELQRQAPLMEMMSSDQEMGWWAPELLRQEAAASSAEAELHLSWMGPELQRQSTALEAEALMDCGDVCVAGWASLSKKAMHA